MVTEIRKYKKLALMFMMSLVCVAGARECVWATDVVEETTETSTEIPQQTEQEPIEKEYVFANSKVESAVEEKTIHDVVVEVGDKKKIKMSKSSKKTVSVQVPVYSENQTQVSYSTEKLSFTGFVLESYTSSNETVAKISKASTDTYPTVAALSTGTATIKLVYSYSYDGVKAYYQTTATVTVTGAQERNEGLYDATIMRGESVNYTATLKEKTNTYTDEKGKLVTETMQPVISSWTSSAPEKVSVKDGLVNGLLQGTVTITLKYKYAFSDGTLTCQAKCKVTSNCYLVEGQTITFQHSVLNDADAAAAINAATTYARDNATDELPYTIKFDAGTYRLASATIKVFSNTTFDMSSGAVLKFAGVGGADGSRGLIKLGTTGVYDGETNYNNSQKCAGYGGFRNIYFVGGTIESTDINKSTHIVMAHATNVVFDGVTISGGAGMHMMEIAAIDGFMMKDCVFKDFKGSKNIKADTSTGRVAYSKIYGNYEALQFDVVASDDCFGGVYMDGTPMKNIQITGCTFDGVPRGLGSHTMILGSYHEDVEISNNTFLNTTKEAMNLLGFRKCRIYDNTITGCGAGIIMENFSDSATYVLTKVFEGTVDYAGQVIQDVDTEIMNNKISITNRGVARETVGILLFGRKISADYQSKRPTTGKAWGDIKKGTYYISNVRVENNTIETAGYGIHFSCARKCTVKNNKITGANFTTKGKYSGIYASEYSAIGGVTENYVEGMNGNGISVAASSTITGSITGNEVRKVAGSALKIDNTKNALTVSNNIFTTKSKTSNVVNISTGSTNKNRVSIISNSISGVGGSTAAGIYHGSGTCTIEKNKIAKVNFGVQINKKNSNYKLGSNTYRSTVKTKKKIEK